VQILSIDTDGQTAAQSKVKVSKFDIQETAHSLTDIIDTYFVAANTVSGEGVLYLFDMDQVLATFTGVKGLGEYIWLAKDSPPGQSD
jgi:hypothetical protein